MDDKELRARLDNAMGEAVFAALSQAALWTLLVRNGVIGRDQATEAIDEALRLLERTRGAKGGAASGIVDYARSRAEALLRALSPNSGTPPG